MPHRCTKCGSVFGDGDSVILTGCPECKWNKFLYVRKEEMSPLKEPKQEDGLTKQEFDDDLTKREYEDDLTKREYEDDLTEQEYEDDLTEQEYDDQDDKEIEILMKKQNENTQEMNSVLENIDKALDLVDGNQKDLDIDRVDSIRILDSGSYELNLESILKNEDIVVGIKEEGQYAIDLPVILQKSNKATKSKKKK